MKSRNKIGGLVLIVTAILLAFYTNYTKPDSAFTFNLIAFVLMIVGFVILSRGKSGKEKSKEISNE